LAIFQITFCCKKTPEEIKHTTFAHPRDLMKTKNDAIEDESTSFATTESSEVSTEATSTSTSTTTEKPFVLEIFEAFISDKHDLILRWNNSNNMTVPLTKIDDLKCNFEGVMPWDMSSSVTITDGCVKDDILVVIKSEIYGDHQLAFDEDEGIIKENFELIESKAFNEKEEQVIDDIYKKRSRVGRVLSLDSDENEIYSDEAKLISLDENAGLVIDEIYSRNEDVEDESHNDGDSRKRIGPVLRLVPVISSDEFDGIGRLGHDVSHLLNNEPLDWDF